MFFWGALGGPVAMSLFSHGMPVLCQGVLNISATPSVPIGVSVCRNVIVKKMQVYDLEMK